MSERAPIVALLLLLCGGCTLLESVMPPATEPETTVVAVPDSPEWLLDPRGYGERIRAYDAMQRQHLVDEALAEFTSRPDFATHIRLALVLDNAVIALREHVETAIRIEQLVGDDATLEPNVAAVLLVQIDRINARVAALQTLAAASKRIARLSRQVRELEGSQSETEAALEVAQEKLEALKSIEQSLRRE